MGPRPSPGAESCGRERAWFERLRKRETVLGHGDFALGWGVRHRRRLSQRKRAKRHTDKGAVPWHKGIIEIGLSTAASFEAMIWTMVTGRGGTQRDFVCVLGM